MTVLGRGCLALFPHLRRATITWSVAVFLCVTVTPSAAQNLSIRDVPLKPWTGFARSWDWTYDALHKLVLSGIAGRVVLNTKPMSRREMALIVGDIVRRIQDNQVTGYDDRPELQDILLDLMSEFSPELRALGLTGYGIKGEPPRLVEVKPIEYLQFRAGYTSNSATNLENSNGERLDIGLNGRVTSSSWFEAAGIVAGYIQPEYQIGEDTNRGQLIEGYVKARGGPVELVVGRESVWWGPGFHGSTLFSNNALAMNMVRLRTANQVTLPWVFADLFGPLKFELFWGQLEEERNLYPSSKVTGLRIDVSPFPWLEIGFARTIVFDGDGRPKPQWYEWPRVWFFGNKEGTEGSKYAGDNRFQLDVSLRLANVGKYVPISRDAELYLDLGWDDTCCGTFYWPIKPGPVVGVYLPNLFGSPDTTFRFEYSNSSSFQFTQGVWQDGYIRKGQVISHFEGTAGEDWFFRLTQRLNPQIDVGIEFDWARIGRTEYGLEFATKELKRYFGVDVSYQHSPALSLNFASRVEWTNNLDFVPGRREVNQVYTAAVTYAFEPTIGTGKRATLPPKDVPPVDLPPAKPDPDQILSRDYAAKTAKDGWSLLTAPTRWDTTDWLIAGGVVAATGGAMLLDTQVRRTAQDNRTHGGDNAAQIVTNLGFILPAAGAVTSYVLGEAFGDEKAKQRAADAVEATIFSSALVFSTDFLIGRSKPDLDRGSQDYHPFNISGSLPSFHTAEAFTAAAVAAEHWDNPWISALAYGFATSVGLSRIYLDKHWLSDVVLGAAVGTVVGKAVVALNKNRRGSPVSIVPLMAPGSWGAALHYQY